MVLYIQLYESVLWQQCLLLAAAASSGATAFHRSLLKPVG